jgi:hypothetical protein
MHVRLCQLPGVRRRRLHPQGRGDAARERGQEGRGPDRLPQLQRARKARTDRQININAWGELVITVFRTVCVYAPMMNWC